MGRLSAYEIVYISVRGLVRNAHHDIILRRRLQEL